MTIFAATGLALAVCTRAAVGAQSIEATYPADGKVIEYTDVVYSVVGATFPTHKPICTLESEDGRQYNAIWEFPWDAHRAVLAGPLRDLGGPYSRWKRGVFQDIPVGNYTFVGRTSPFHPCLRIANVKVTAIAGYGCYPEELQKLELVEPNSIALGFIDKRGEPVEAKQWQEEYVRVVHEGKDGLTIQPNRILELEKIRIDQEYVAPGYWLIIRGHHPIPLEGVEDGDGLQLEPTPSVDLDTKFPANWPQGWYTRVSLHLVKEGNSMAHHQLEVGKYVDWLGTYSFPHAGEYRVHWYLIHGENAEHHEDWSFEIPGTIIRLEAADTPQVLSLDIPTEMVAAAWKAEAELKPKGIPIIEIKVESSEGSWRFLPEIPPPPPTSSQASEGKE